MPTFFAAVKDIKDTFRRRAFRAALLAEWAATNPLAGLAFLQAKDKSLIPHLLREWLRIDPQGAINELLRGNNETRGSLLGLLNDIARTAPGRLAEVINALPKPSSKGEASVRVTRDTTVQNAFAAFAEKDLTAARAAAEAVTGDLRTQALAGVAKALAEKDGPAALAWGQSMPAGPARNEILKAALIGMAKNDPIGSLEKIDLVPPGGEENYASDVAALVLAEAGKRDWEGTLRWIQEHPGKLGRFSLNGLMGVLSKRLSAFPADTMRSLEKSGAVVSEVFGNALLNDGYGARVAILDWLDAQPASDFTRSARSSLVNAMAWKEPNVALEYLKKLPDTADNRALFERGAQSLLNGGNQMHQLDEFLANASPTMRPFLIEAGLQFLPQGQFSDPAKWVKYLNEIPEERRGNAVIGLARGWARSDPETALQWSLTLTDPAQRESALGYAAGTWATEDAVDAAHWVNALPAGANRDIGAQVLALSLARSEPETAWTWALSVANADRRRGALQAAYVGLLEKDAGIAQQMLQSANLPPAEVKAIADAMN